MTEEQQNVWRELKLNKQLITAVDEAGFSEPTAIQTKCIPLILGGQAVIGIAQTGTGKTAAYMLPLLLKVKYQQGQTHGRSFLFQPKSLLSR